MNKFQNFAGEIGYRISSEHQLRLTIGEVKLTERHLSSEWEAYAVDGENVEGYFRIYELNYDRSFFKRKTWYAGSQCGLCSEQIPFHHLGRSHRQ